MEALYAVSAYKFLPLEALTTLKQRLQEEAQVLNLRGTVLLAAEGINCFFSGTKTQTQAYQTFISHTLGFGELPYKISPAIHQPFRRMIVKIRAHGEIVTMGIPSLKPDALTAPRISPEELKRWFDEGREFLLLDTRNDYELRIGAFKGTFHLNLDHFKQFPEAVNNLDPSFKKKTIVTCCTGGIRCEKAAPYMLSLGFKHVYQLDGGILGYFERCGGTHWEGDCFVFDHRVAVKPDLSESQIRQCFACREPLTLQEQADPRYVPGMACPYCAATPHARAVRRAQTQALKE